MYIHELNHWTDFRWDGAKIAILLDEIARLQGLLHGRQIELAFLKPCSVTW
ncbi:MAG: DUF4172 domain-containing protein [Mediterranea sp.]|jgi:hypothetical protein|nr:DUF4172 domain-containing protein [Mediterranea sp.]